MKVMKTCDLDGSRESELESLAAMFREISLKTPARSAK
jgi:hypothetical protein